MINDAGNLIASSTSSTRAAPPPRPAVVKVRYQKAFPPGNVRFQAHPPVCNICGQPITRDNFGYAYLESEEDTKRKRVERFERIECTSCTPIRENGDALRAFLLRHQL